MKNYITLITLFITLISCKAQNPIISINELGWKNADNTYYKDLNNTLNNFEGTWLYTNGNTSLKIILKKYIMLYNGKYYEDEIIGGYQYIKNGIEKINTLSDANNPNLGISASIDGNTIHRNCRYLPVDNCVNGEKSLSLSINDITSAGHVGSLRLFKRTINGQKVLKANIEMSYLPAISGRPPTPTLPWYMRNIVLIKQ